ncbi:cupin domain-containing protein [Dyella terrae]|uniref:cupin domain-containing protein n=1 Tax=Dyella terrae TaxID=522259 RepID=UPI001EFD3390|nr:cupin domain-containing protein [Dyella terrae]ULU24098.1 cupin domain-containing protein [Dyella terrae]
MLNKYIWTVPLCLFASFGVMAAEAGQGGNAPKVITPSDLPFVQVSEGVRLKELTGHAAPDGAKSKLGSVALFELDPGHASAWSHNKAGEESFFILEGHGEVWTGGVAHPVGPGDYILIPPAVVRSIRASKGEVLKFYAITTPAWSKDDDVLVPAPKGAPGS